MAKVDMFYINLSSAKERNDRFIDSFKRAGFSSEWSMNRFDALSGGAAEVSNAPGVISDALKGNYLSHLKCVELSMDLGNHVFVAEDDTIFDRRTGPFVDAVLNALPEEMWDVAMLDVYIPNAEDMPKLYKRMRDCARRGAVETVCLYGWPTPYAGAGAYIVNKNSKEKFISMLTKAELDNPFDLELRKCLYRGELVGVLTLPFLTTISQEGDLSQVQGADRNFELMLLHAFRRLCWIGASDTEALPKHFHELDHGPHDDDVNTFCAIMKPLMAMQIGR